MLYELNFLVKFSSVTFFHGKKSKLTLKKYYFNLLFYRFGLEGFWG